MNPGMFVGAAVDFGVGALCVVLGILLWKKQMISLIHDYHHSHVRKEDIPAYTRMIGIGLLLIGAGVSITGVLQLVSSSLWWIPLSCGLVGGFFVMNAAQKKYNGSWFG